MSGVAPTWENQSLRLTGDHTELLPPTLETGFRQLELRLGDEEGAHWTMDLWAFFSTADTR